MVAVYSSELEPYVGLTPRGGGATHVSVFATAKTREKEGERRRKMYARRNGFDRGRGRVANSRKFVKTDTDVRKGNDEFFALHVRRARARARASPSTNDGIRTKQSWRSKRVLPV